MRQGDKEKKARTKEKGGKRKRKEEEEKREVGQTHTSTYNTKTLTKHSQTPASLFLALAKNKLAGVCECFVSVFSQRDAF